MDRSKAQSKHCFGIWISFIFLTGLLWWLSGEAQTGHCRRRRFDPWVGKIPWRRKWQPTSEFLPGKSHGLHSLVGYSPWGCKRVRCDLAAKQQMNVGERGSCLTIRIRVFRGKSWGYRKTGNGSHSEAWAIVGQQKQYVALCCIFAILYIRVCVCVCVL